MCPTEESGFGRGVEGKCKGCKTVGFEQKTRGDGEFSSMKEVLPSQVSGFLFPFSTANIHPFFPIKRGYEVESSKQYYIVEAAIGSLGQVFMASLLYSLRGTKVYFCCCPLPAYAEFSKYPVTGRSQLNT